MLTHGFAIFRPRPVLGIVVSIHKPEHSAMHVASFEGWNICATHKHEIKRRTVGRNRCLHVWLVSHAAVMSERKTIPDYVAYAAKHVYNVNVPGCSTPGRMFVGQRKDPFAVNLGAIFDLVNAPVSFITDPTKINAVPNQIDDANVTSLALDAGRRFVRFLGEPRSGAQSHQVTP